MSNAPLVGAAAFVLTLAVSGPAAAITITNRDATAHNVLVTEGGDETVTSEVVIEADQTRDDLCPAGCTLVLADGEPQSFEGYEVLVIEDGRFETVE